MSTTKKERERQEAIFKALADYRRREMLDLLRDKPQTTGDICNTFKDLDRCTVMQHLGVLEKAELIIVKREGRHRWNYINPLPIKEIYDRWISRYATYAIDILARMKHDLETH
ncbi:helix-turn-helix transcriptional regulator [Alloacidobacterium dinghuense]|uniref:Helix-turn-helix transcriptional regulator n=1 Tax=Alloacidobacterium dinghuense TaxID=2763107 RepID=A0A7G8BKA1_9BACT|nr:helix-turn-helix domain-containing protein [Alloacidobacterium dinghuense]QNI32971.1 helix-turn-helix transcriptional regulator [Alloacidobacterium dinghuense]